MSTWDAIRTEAEHVIEMADDDQYIGGQLLAEMVLEMTETSDENAS